MSRHHRVAVVVVVIVLSASLAGCVQATPTSSSKPTAAATSSAGPTPVPTETKAPTLSVNGSAADNKAFFDLVNTRLFTANGSANGRTIIDNLVAAGFIKKNMQVTPDLDAIGHAADSVLFSVKIGNSCLLGQHGGAGYSSSVAPALTSGGACLIGKTRTIDW
jgi:ABC-type transport system substrate-binding protein